MESKYIGGGLAAAGFLIIAMCPDIVFSSHVVTPICLIIIGIVLFILGRGHDGGPKGGSKSDIGEKPVRHFYNFNLAPGA